MLHWDSLDVLDASGAVSETVPATVYVKSHGIVNAEGQADGMTLGTVLKATVDPSTEVTTDNLVSWKGDRYEVRSVVPVAAKGIVRFIHLTLARYVG